ncbi:MAG: FkbM family methyltransferase [Acidimicrobiales bacterium]
MPEHRSIGGARCCSEASAIVDPTSIADNLRIAHAAVGTARTVRLVADRLAGRRDRERPVRVDGLTHPFTTSGHLSDLEMLAQVRHSPVLRALLDVIDATTTDPILDIGANIGTTATFFASHFPYSTVTAVEPSERNRALLVRNAAPYGERIRVIGAAITPTGGLAYQLSPTAAATDEFCGLRYGPAAIELEEAADMHAVPAMTLAELHIAIGSPSKLALVKLDVEGGERELAVAGLTELLALTDAFVVETHDRHRPGANAAVEQAATEAGLRRMTSDGNDHLYAR